jgi:hypothetical protein
MATGQIGLPNTPTSPWFQQNAPPTDIPVAGHFNPNPTPTPPVGTQLAPTFNPGQPLPGMATQGPYILPPKGVTPINPSQPFPTGPAATTAPTTPAATTPPAGSTNYNARLPGESTRDWVIRAAKGIGRDDIASNPDYWVSAIESKPQSSDMSYWLGRLQTPDTGGSGDSAGGFGAFTAPYTGTYVPPVTNFQAPVGTDDPGFKFAVEQGQDAIARSAAAKGNLLTGGTLKDLASYTTGAALQDYAGSYNRALNTAGFNNNTAFQAFGQNYDIFRNNQNDPFQKLYATTGLGLNAAGQANSALGGYSNNLSDLTNNFASQYVNLTTGQGNARATGTQVGSAQQNQFYQSLSDWLRNYKF